MTNVIAFKPDLTTSRTRDRDAESAQILFFTGVRYVRFSDLDEAAEDAIFLEVASEPEPSAEIERLLA